MLVHARRPTAVGHARVAFLPWGKGVMQEREGGTGRRSLNCPPGSDHPYAAPGAFLDPVGAHSGASGNRIGPFWEPSWSL
eukprot:4003865-Pyramimonas_sp.AAC.1